MDSRCFSYNHFNSSLDQREVTEARGIAAAIVQMSPNLRLAGLAKLLGREQSALGKAAQRVTVKARGNGIVSGLIDQLRAVST